MSAYVAHAFTLSLTWFIVANAVSSVAVAMLGSRLVAPRSMRRSARAWFAWRMAPAAMSFVFVAAVFVPSYWQFEPRDSVEGFDVTSTVCAAAAVLMMAIGVLRGARAWCDAERRTRAWVKTAAPLEVECSRLPAFVVQTPAPLMALAGIVRPRVFVSARLLTALTADELSATIAHEASHWRAADNLKRLMMRMAPDFLHATAIARRVECEWAAAAERSADDFGAGADPATRCALASALVKVARLMPQVASPLEPISTLVGGGELASRVQRLLDEPPPAARHRSRRAIAATLAAGAALAMTYGPLLRAIHDATEILVNSLP
jgi:peptidase M48-like protein